MLRNERTAAGPLLHRLDRVEVLVARGVELVSTAWDPARHPRRATDRTEAAVVELMLGGAFRLRCRRGIGVGDASTAVLFAAGEEFAVDHPVPRANRGLSVRIAPEALEEWWEPGARASGRGWAVELAAPAAASLGAQALLRRIDAGDEVERLELGSRVAGLLGALPLPRPIERGATGRASGRARDRVHHVRALLAARVDAPPSLEELAREVDWTPWHLAHEFTRWHGTPLHAHARTVRLRAVLARLGTAPIGELAHAHGFASHSHLSAWFRREFGVSPRAASSALR